MTPTDMEDAIRNLDTRLTRVEQILPTLATKTDFEDAKRHASVLYESLRDDIRIVAEGLATLTGNVTTLTGNVTTLTGTVTTLSGTVGLLTGRVDVLTGNVDTLTGKVDTLTGKVDTLTGKVERNDSALAALAERLQDVTVRLERKGVI